MLTPVFIFLTAASLTASLTTKDPTCVDRDLYCAVLSNTRFCDNNTLVQRQCPRTCNLCSTGASTTATVSETPIKTTSLPTSPTLPEMTTTAFVCMDRAPTCANFTNTTYCETVRLVREMCPITCGVCVAECVDVDPDCPVLLQTHFCTEDLAKRLCPATCHVCERITTTASTVTYKTTELPCVDLDPKCTALKNKSLECAEFSLVRRLCPETCNLCFHVPPFLGPLSCRTCEDPYCEMGVEADYTCPDHAPFCMNIVGQDSRNIPTLTKRCADRKQCEERWLNGSALNTQCRNLTLDSPPEVPFECTFCCVTPECNVPAIPRAETLFRDLSST